MAAETAKQFEALERQAQTLMAAFVAAGYEAVAPAMIQPATVFLDVVGEALRARTYVFTDPDGNELCLRPDLTVPTCRLHLERQGAHEAQGRYCYNGPAFRFQPAGADATHPREFRQAGIENFGDINREESDAETVATILAALRDTGLERTKLRLGDFGLFSAILDAAGLSERLRGRITRQFRRPDTFRAELQKLAREPHSFARNIPEALQTALKRGNGSAEKVVALYLDEQKIDPTGMRSISEIAATLTDRVADAATPPLRPQIAELIERYAGLSAPLSSATKAIRDMAQKSGLDISASVDAFERRLSCLAKSGIASKDAEFSSSVGRSFQYYTGFTFELTTQQLGDKSPIAGGGRYDGLMRAIGATQDIPAVGAAIHTERLLAAVAEGRS